MLCPRCDQQGHIVRARIITTGEIVHLCDECDALWPSGSEVTKTGFADFSTYVKPLGLRGAWEEIMVVDES
jgi:hypothetical protein